MEMKKNKECYLCSGKDFKKIQNRVRDNCHLEVLECLSCGLVFLSSFAHMCDDFYKNSKMHDEKNIEIDTWLRETSHDDQRRFMQFKKLIKNKSILDFGCGAGGFLLKARAMASHVAGIELEKRLKGYFLKEKLMVYSDINKIKVNFDVITLFHVLEHAADPASMLRKLARRLNCKGCLIVEVPNANDALISLYNNAAFKDFTYWSCHLFYFTISTLTLLAKKAGIKLNYIKQIQRYPLSNHLYWLAKDKPGGHKEWSFLNSNALNNNYEKQLASLGCCDTIIASFS